MRHISLSHETKVILVMTITVILILKIFYAFLWETVALIDGPNWS